jgi:transcription antitermination factor NusG
MQYLDTDIFWYTLFTTDGKAAKIKSCLEEASIECFFPILYYNGSRIKDPERDGWISPSFLENLIFAKSSKSILNPMLEEVKLRFSVSSDLYYRDCSSEKTIIVPENQMRNFIAVAGNRKEDVLFLSNEYVNVRKGVKVKITGGVFVGVEGVFMRIKGAKRLVVSIPNLFSVATMYIPTQFVEKIF